MSDTEANIRQARDEAAEDWITGRGYRNPYPGGTLEQLYYTLEYQNLWKGKYVLRANILGAGQTVPGEPS